MGGDAGVAAGEGLMATMAAPLAGPPRRLVVTVRAPGLGERWLSIRLG